MGAGGLRVVIAEKAVIERSGATGEGLSAINCYMGQRYGWNTPEDFVRYVVNDMMGLAREDLVYDVGRHVDSSVHLLEEWGLPIWKKDNGEYERIGRWQISHSWRVHQTRGRRTRPQRPGRRKYLRARCHNPPANRRKRPPTASPGPSDSPSGKTSSTSSRPAPSIVTSGGASNVFPAPLGQRRLGPHLVLGIRHRLRLRPDDSRRGGNDPDGTPFRSHPVQGRLWPGGYVVPVFPRPRHQRPGRGLHRDPRRRTGQVSALWPRRSHSHAAAQSPDVPGHPGRSRPTCICVPKRPCKSCPVATPPRWNRCGMKRGRTFST